jgi:hypothetical protein
MRTRLRSFASLLIGFVLWITVSSGPAGDASSERYVGAAQALAIGGQGIPSSAVNAARVIVHVSHPAPRSSLATPASAFALRVLPRGHEAPLPRTEALRRPPALAFPYDATAPPVGFEL